MATDRWRLLTGLTLAIAVLAGAVLSDVLTTILLACAAGYVLLPIHRWFRTRGISTYWSATATAALAALSALLVVVPFVYVAVVQREDIRRVLTQLDAEFTLVFVGETPINFNLGLVREAFVPTFVGAARFLAARLPSVSAKVVVFVFVVFALLYYNDRLGGFVSRLMPERHHDVVVYTHERVHDVLFAHFAIAFVGGTATYLLGMIVFLTFGQPFPATIALVAALFWLLPVVTVGFLVLVLALGYLLSGDLAGALLVGMLGAVFLVAVPNAIVARMRQRWNDPQGLSPTAYLVGFIGGGVTLGPAGVVLGPLAVTVLLAIRDLLAQSNTTLDLTADGTSE